MSEVGNYGGQPVLEAPISTERRICLEAVQEKHSKHFFFPSVKICALLESIKPLKEPHSHREGVETYPQG